MQLADGQVFDEQYFDKQAQAQGYWDITLSTGERLVLDYWTTPEEPTPQTKHFLWWQWEAQPPTPEPQPTTEALWAREYAWWVHNGFNEQVALEQASKKMPLDQVRALSALNMQLAQTPTRV